MCSQSKGEGACSLASLLTLRKAFTCGIFLQLVPSLGTRLMVVLSVWEQPRIELVPLECYEFIMWFSGNINFFHIPLEGLQKHHCQ